MTSHLNFSSCAGNPTSRQFTICSSCCFDVIGGLWQELKLIRVDSCTLDVDDSIDTTLVGLFQMLGK